ncbi:hypothetical protein RS130_14195 [Paraglaciecola aquimarina]|uniref:Uncharacterized protein n=1 Tax=Paraglaciecola aquimarina TaxID=1235557 RepID=A0ABU3SY32_9ALTE|nr:hypothetical protein [Paraglaciecola aquimarina]MDU0354906.1 hypothetical protein [Paraglaciecola aquimarina]
MKSIFYKNNISQTLASTLFVAGLASCGGGGSNTPATTKPPIVNDTTPNSYHFNDLTHSALSASLESNSIVVSGIDAPSNISISGGEYKIANGSYTSATGTVINGQTVTVRLTTSNNYATETQAELTIGGIKDTFSATTMEQPAPTLPMVQVNLDMKHSVGGIATFDRQKFITIHASTTENGWGENDAHSRHAKNKDPDLMPNFVTDYDVYFGRDTGSFGWALRNLPEDPARLGFVDEVASKTRGDNDKWIYSNNTNDKYIDARQHESRGLDMVVGLQQFPYYPEGDKDNNPVTGINPGYFLQPTQQVSH